MEIDSVNNINVECRGEGKCYHIHILYTLYLEYRVYIIDSVKKHTHREVLILQLNAVIHIFKSFASIHPESFMKFQVE